MTHTSARKWSIVFLLAALFNFAMGGPIVFVPGWSFEIAYRGPSSGLALQFWRDFGFAVVIIGLGYLMVAQDVRSNRGIVWLGIFAKLFDVLTLSWRASNGSAHPIVLLPAAIDGVFVILFVQFLLSTTKKRIVAEK